MVGVLWLTPLLTKEVKISSCWFYLHVRVIFVIDTVPDLQVLVNWFYMEEVNRISPKHL
jgi:hypothetical protein